MLEKKSSDISKSIGQYLQSKLPCDEVIASDQDVLMSGILDSLGIADLLSFLEQQFKLKIPFEDVTVENFSTIRAMTSFVEKKIRADRRCS